MLKHIELSDLELGMFVHKMEGGWFDHPFWKSNFLIQEQKQLQLLVQSKLRGVVIDTSKGKDVPASTPKARAPARQPGAIEATRIAAISKRSKHEADSSRPVSIAQELNAAQAIANKAKENLHRTFMAARLGKAMNVKTVEPIVSDILASVRRNPQAFSGLMRCKLKNELMFRHALSVSALMVSLARKMKLPSQEVHECGLAGLLLDIGVNYLPQTLDPPNGDFRSVDPKIWQQHVMLGYRGLVNDNDLPQPVIDAVLQHHERMDGSGFPKSLEGQEISTVARMAAICDTFDFMLSQTSTVAACDPASAVQQMKAMSGAFDDELLREFIESVGLYPVGSFVRLHSEKLAMVIDEDHKDHTKPIVQAFYSYATGEQIKPHRIALARGAETDHILSVADLSELGLPEEAHLREMIFLSTYKNMPG
ncbi:HD domain-containing phosphohydrolase [Erythrobacter sp.]|uniref:HD-GYP domain-containing protein n=1 Tax=Erythrobacter sp. TaxID=1042 RepID=UPI0025DE747E|nr:HD domain-containing phosphohydrolase [Erythrobacter sp.]